DFPATEQVATLPFFRVPAQRDFPDPVGSNTVPHIEVGGSAVKTRMKGVKKTRPCISTGVQSAGAPIVDRMAPAVVDTELCSPALESAAIQPKLKGSETGMSSIRTISEVRDFWVESRAVCVIWADWCCAVCRRSGVDVARVKSASVV